MHLTPTVTAEWEAAHGPMFGGPAGVDTFRVTIVDKVWPADGSKFAGISYRTETRTINGIIDRVDNYPTPAAELAA